MSSEEQSHLIVSGGRSRDVGDCGAGKSSSLEGRAADGDVFARG